MSFTKSILCGVSAISLSVGAVFAGESSTDRWHGTGPAYYETNVGLRAFNQSCAEGSLPSDCSIAMNSSYSSGHAFSGSQTPDMSRSVGS